jgi:hypothetical protein
MHHPVPATKGAKTKAMMTLARTGPASHTTANTLAREGTAGEVMTARSESDHGRR